LLYIDDIRDMIHHLEIMMVNEIKYLMVYWKVVETAVMLVDEMAENWVYSRVVLMVVMKVD
jgi:hypothetical protein